MYITELPALQNLPEVHAATGVETTFDNDHLVMRPPELLDLTVVALEEVGFHEELQARILELSSRPDYLLQFGSIITSISSPCCQTWHVVLGTLGYGESFCHEHILCRDLLSSKIVVVLISPHYLEQKGHLPFLIHHHSHYFISLVHRALEASGFSVPEQLDGSNAGRIARSLKKARRLEMMERAAGLAGAIVRRRPPPRLTAGS